MNDNALIITELDNSQNIECFSLNDTNGCLNLLNPGYNSKYSFLVLTLNIRSINCNFDLFLAFVSSLDVSVDVFVLTECWLNGHSPPTLDDFNVFWTKNNLNQNDGVVAYVRQDIDATSSEPAVSEGNCLLINVSSDYTIVCSYRSPSFRNASKYLESLTILLDSITAKNIVFTGDINLDILNNNLSIYSQDYLTLMAMHGLKQGINLPTRVTTCIDHFMVKCHSVFKTIVFEQQLTDHSPILLYINRAEINKKVLGHNSVKVNYDKIKESLIIESWQDFFNISDVNLATDLFTSKLQSLININTEIRKVSKRNNPIKPWITKGVVRCIRKRDRLHKRVKKAPENDTIKNKYIKYRNICNKIIKNLKKDYYRQKLIKSNGNVKETWKVIKEVCNFGQSRVPSRELLKVANHPTQSLNAVNSYFTSIGKTLANETLCITNKTESKLASSARAQITPPNSMCLLPTDPHEVKSIIFRLKTHSAPGWDKITVNILKLFYMYLVEPITYLCNLSLQTGVFPAAFKQAVVCPVFKAGCKSSPSNYRPISLLSTLSKVLEKLVKRRVMRYLEKNELLNHNQYGFREGRSTEDAVLKLTTLISSYLDGGNKCLGVFLDLQKAFDTVSIPILLTRLENVGIRGIAHEWFSDYLSGRTQRVRVESHESDEEVCTYGVPQGSTLGPALFLIYINDLCSITLPGLDLLMFADDTVLLVHDKSWQTVVEMAESCLSHVTNWLENSLLSLNTSKTKYMCFTMSPSGDMGDSISVKIHTFPCNQGSPRPPSCSCAILSRVPTIKYLGVVIDDKLNWSPHIASLASRVRKLIYTFKALRSIADLKLVVQTYRALGECLLRYCICAWGRAAKTHLIKAERAQRAVLKVIQFLPFRHPTTDVYERAGVLSVRKLFIYEAIRRYHKKTVPTLPVNTKRVDRCPVPLVKSRFAQKQYNVVAPQLYNKFNKQYKIKLKSNNEIKKPLLLWLQQFDYDAMEKVLNDFYF